MVSSRNQINERMRSRIFIAAITSGVKCAAIAASTAVDLGLDHVRPRPWGRRAAPAPGRSRAAPRRCRPLSRSSRRTRHGRRPARARRWRRASSGVGSAMAPNWSLGRRARKRTRTSASDDRRRADPVERGQRLVIIEPAEQRRKRRLGEHGDADDQRRDMAERIDQQPLPDDLAARARARTGRSSRRA